MDNYLFYSFNEGGYLQEPHPPVLGVGMLLKEPDPKLEVPSNT
ncbi:MAG: hypothetical protein ACM3ZR_03935 [Pseudomonadota bacterium]